MRAAVSGGAAGLLSPTGRGVGHELSQAIHQRPPGTQPGGQAVPNPDRLPGHGGGRSSVPARPGRSCRQRRLRRHARLPVRWRPGRLGRAARREVGAAGDAPLAAPQRCHGHGPDTAAGQVERPGSPALVEGRRGWKARPGQPRAAAAAERLHAARLVLDGRGAASSRIPALRAGHAPGDVGRRGRFRRGEGRRCGRSRPARCPDRGQLQRRRHRQVLSARAGHRAVSGAAPGVRGSPLPPARSGCGGRGAGSDADARRAPPAGGGR